MTGATSIDQNTQPAIAAAVDVLDLDGTVKTHFQIMPFGTPIDARDGRKHNLRDKGHAAAVLQVTKAVLGAAEMSMDYDHQAFTAANTQVGGTAKASGWVQRLHIKDDGIWADVTWTKAARASLEAREYRYVSPFYRFDPKSGDVVRLVNVGLTNTPAFDMPAVAAETSDNNQGLTNMKAIALALGLSEDATEAQILEAIAEWKKAKSGAAATASALTGIGAVLGLAADADADAITAAATAAQEKATEGAAASEGDDPDPSKYVPRADFDALAGRVNDRDAADAVAMVDQGVADGKIAPATKQYWLDRAKVDAPAVANFLAVAPAIVGGKLIDGKPAGDGESLTEEEAAACETMGWDQAEYLEQKKKDKS